MYFSEILMCVKVLPYLLGIKYYQLHILHILKMDGV
jgi:hypothetical protein